jgi:uncharacterized protein (TIGR02996 family)
VSDDIELSFIDAIRNNPDDDEARAVYADWLEERGDLRGEYLRLEAQLHRIPPRLVELARSISPTWLVTLARRYDVVLVSAGPNKIHVIRETRQVTGLGLKDAKDAVEHASEATPFVIRRGIDRKDAEAIVAQLAATGATARIAPHATTATTPAFGYETDVVLVSVVAGRNIYAIKIIRELTNLGLQDAKNIIDGVAGGNRYTLAQRVDAASAAQLAARFEGIGTVELVSSHVPAP